ncbi:anoctamin-3-like isoform X2 [Tribolium madens]|uniref:anoctamin-3-like isoform X2 n=1 Tax=Tribolium madens TaxID=41895 RepID=UPI001CF72CF7|nr:anoctamin-3-like isoform X2 [Tribolium madens]
MNLQEPKEENEPLLPKTCYFSDGKTKVDYVIVYAKQEHIRTDNSLNQINQFIKFIKDKGLLVERDLGKFYNNLYFIKIHGPHNVLVRYAKIYNICLTCQNPYYKYKETTWFDFLTTEVTKPNPESEVYQRAEKTLSGNRPTEITTAERSLIVFEILKRISFLINDDEFTLKIMLQKEIFLQAFPIHDGDCDWTTEGLLTDRQLLFQFWTNVKHLFKDQPVHLIEKYYGPKIAFYFALVNFYTRMLLVPTVIGVMTVLTGVVLLFKEHFIEDEVCNSKVTICSDQKLLTACTLMKLAYVIDNPVTIVYVILCSFWGAIFWNMWQRRQAMLRLRWNLTGLKTDRTMRREFQENANTRKSSITGEIEYYIPPHKKVLSAVFSYSIIFIMIIIIFLIVFLMVQYRFFVNKSLNYDETKNANEIELFTSSIITAVIIMLINQCTSFLMTTYSKIIRFMTHLRQPRTQTQYNQMYLHMTFILIFANHFSPLFYLAYIKGFLHTYPGNLSKFSIISTLQTDLCKPSGCLIDLGIQLITLMVIKTSKKFFEDFMTHHFSPWQKKAIRDPTVGQWERDFDKQELSDAVINELYTELVLQYSFITFFNASLPIIGLIALIHNLLKSQHDSYIFLKFYRRPSHERVADIQGWNHILKAVTIFGTISNAFIVAFRTDFVLRVLYQKTHDGSLKGYVNSTLSKFAVKDYQREHLLIDHKNESFCFYRGFRYPPEHEKKYEPTLDHWYYFAVKSLYFIIIENVTLILSLVLGYLIPEMPRKVKVKLEYDEQIIKSAREARLELEKW